LWPFSYELAFLWERIVVLDDGETSVVDAIRDEKVPVVGRTPGFDFIPYVRSDRAAGIDRIAINGVGWPKLVPKSVVVSTSA